MEELEAIAHVASKRGKSRGENNEKSKYFARLLHATRPILKPEHPASQDLNEILHREMDPSGNVRAHIIHDEEKDAFMMLHGEMYVTTGLLNIVDTEEELIWLLGHEYSHFEDTKRARTRENAKTWEEYVADSRIKEYKGDISSFLRMNRAGRNPMAGVSLLEKLSKGERSGGLVHGDTLHRIINLHWISRLMDLKGIDASQMPWRASIANITPDNYLRAVPNLAVLANPLGNDETYSPEFRNCDVLSAVAAYAHINEHKDDFEAGITGRTNYRVLSSRLFQMIESAAEDAVSHLPDPDAKSVALAELVSILCCEHTPEYAYDAEQLDNFLAVLKPEYFAKLGVVPTYDYGPAALIRAITPNLSGKRKKEYLAKFERQLGAVTGELHSSAKGAIEVSRSLPDAKENPFDQIDGVEMSDIIEITGEFSEQYKEVLDGLGPKEFVRKLFVLKPVLLDYWSSTDLLKDAARETPQDDANRLARTSKDLVQRSYAKVVAEYFGHGPEKTVPEIKTALLASRALDIDPEQVLFSQIGYGIWDIPDLQTSAQLDALMRTLTDDALVKEAHSFAQPAATANKTGIGNQFRSFLIKNVMHESDGSIDALRSTLRESLRVVPEAAYVFEMEAVLKHVLTKLNPASLSTDDLQLIYQLSLFQSSIVRDYVQGKVLPPLTAQMDFAQTFDFVHDGIGKISTMRPIEALIEEKAQKVKDLRKLLAIQKTLARAVTEKPDEGFGNGNSFGYYQKNLKIDRLEFLKCALNTQYGEREMKRMLYRSWRERPESEREKFPFVRMYGIEAALDLQTLYLADLKYKYFTLRTVLADATHGVLVKQDTKRCLAPALLDELVTADDPRDHDVKGIVQNLLGSLVQHAPLHMSYFTLVPLMLNKMFLRPAAHEDSLGVIIDYELDQQKIPKDGPVRQQARDLFTNAMGYGLTTFGSTSKKIPPQRAAWIAFTRSHGILQAAAEDMIDTVYVACTPTHREDSDTDENLQFKNHGIPDHVREFFGEMPPQAAPRKMRPLEFVVETARNLGSPGTRFLQLLGQYARIPSDYQQEFQKVYDNVRGQSKLTAFQTVAREWPDIDKHLSAIEDAVGGGSLTTVYRARWKDGSAVALKVLNPNLTYFNSIAFDVIKNALENLSQRDSHYRIGLEIIDDIRQWVDGDINFTGFLPKDNEFRAQNHGFAGAGGYKIFVPRSYHPESKYFKLEEFVDGTSLTKMDKLREQGHDPKAVVATIARNYFAQLENGRVHADVHPGNFMVTKDKHVAILDRNFFLDFSPEECTNFQSAIGYALMGDAEALSGFVVDNLTSNNGNVKLDKTALRTGLADVLKASIQSKEPLAERLVNVVRYVRSNGYSLPLKTTLLTRNIHALQKLSESAGFASLEQTLAYV